MATTGEDKRDENIARLEQAVLDKGLEESVEKYRLTPLEKMEMLCGLLQQQKCSATL